MDCPEASGHSISLRALAAWGVFGLTCVLVAAGGWLNEGGAGRGQVQPADAVIALAFTATGALSSPANWPMSHGTQIMTSARPARIAGTGWPQAKKSRYARHLHYRVRAPHHT